MIPNNITPEHVLQAIEDYDLKGIRFPSAKSKKFDLDFKGKLYPPKYIVCLANEFINGKYLSHRTTNTNEAQAFLKGLSPDFKIVLKSLDPIAELIKKYKIHIRENGLEQEIYKWKLVKEFQQRPDTNAVDFFQEIKEINFANLVYPVGITVIHHIAKDRTQEYRKALILLFDENTPLNDRIASFSFTVDGLYKELTPGVNHAHHHDERTIATFLTYHNPETYTFFKDSFYQKYCKLINEIPAKKGEKYSHYLELVNDFVDDYIKEDEELLEIIEKHLTQEAYSDTKHYLLAQDILFQVLDKLGETPTIVGLMATDGTGWQDEHIEEMENFDAVALWNSVRPGGTEATLKFLRTYLDENGSFNFYYASRGMVNYKATIIDFAENQNDLDIKGWDADRKVLHYDKLFSEYKDHNKKAAIVFLAKSLEKIDPVPVTSFVFVKGFSSPVHAHISPLQSEPAITIINQLPSIQAKKTDMRDKSFALNQILYGPPGTGKTYRTVEMALNIINDDDDKKLDWKDREKVKSLFEKRVKDDRIIFTTFHQSMTYEDFVEGMKPTLPKEEGQHVNYIIQDGIFKKACANAAYKCYELFLVPQLQKQQYSFDDLYESFIDSLQEKITKKDNPLFTTLTGKQKEVIRINKNDSIIATAKNSRGLKDPAPLTKENLQKLYDKYNDISEITSLAQVKETVGIRPRIGEFYAIFNGLKEFEKSFSPNAEDDIVEELTKISSEEIQKKFNAGVFTDAVKKHGKNAPPVILIIDEINRGNVSQIFGELITLIETDKRTGNMEALDATLTYSRISFSVPPNLYIIGTMNTADRSVEALDSALRRRFSFEEMPPEPKLIASEGASGKSNGIVGGIDLVNLLSKINRRIEKLLDKDHLIGHSYFLEVSNINELKSAFKHKILPLLQEYFFGDYGKMGLVIGSAFFEKEEEENNALFAEMDNYDQSPFLEVPIYKIRNINLMDDSTFLQAIKGI